MVDEVLAVGDAEFQSKAIGKMNEVSSRDGKTNLYVSHNIKAIKHLTQRCLLLSNGIVANIDKTDRVVKSYLQKQNIITGDIEKALVNNNRTNSFHESKTLNSQVLGGEELSEIGKYSSLIECVKLDKPQS